MQQPKRLTLALAGGNALGAYQAGAYQALHERGLRPDWIAGASIGAINGAIIAGNAPENRVEKLKQFWTQAEQFGKPDPAAGQKGASSRFTRRAAVMQAFVAGRPGLFTPRLPGLWSAWPGMPNDVSLFDTRPLLDTLRRCVDFDRLNRGPVRLTATAVDVETGEDVAFDSDEGPIEPEHLRASAAFPVAYPPVEVNGRVFVDPAVSANMPLRVLLATPPAEDTLCLALDLVSPAGARPGSLAEAAKRAHDLVFVNQAKHTIESLGREYRLLQTIRELSGPDPTAAPAGSVTLVHIAYAEVANETAAKMFDYSAASVGERWTAGRRDMEAALDRLPDVGAGSAFQAFRYRSGQLSPYG
jgi:NTE family protein